MCVHFLSKTIRQTALLLQLSVSELATRQIANNTDLATKLKIATYWYPVRILLSYFLALGPPFLKRMLLFVLKLHR